MAATFAPAKAFDFAKRNLKSMPLEQIQARLLDDVSKIIWMAAPWRWTIGALTAIPLTSSTQDYTLAPPADFLYLLHSYITDGVGIPKHLQVVPALPAAVGVNGMPDFIAYQGSNTFRISPNPGVIPGSPTRNIVSMYKKTSPAISPSSIFTAGALIMDDEWFWVYEAGVLWISYLWGDDQRAGSCQVDVQGRVTYTGQLAVFQSALAQMRQREPMPQFDFKATSEQLDTQK